jgi:hypothetical protein
MRAPVEAEGVAVDIIRVAMAVATVTVAAAAAMAKVDIKLKPAVRVRMALKLPAEVTLILNKEVSLLKGISKGATRKGAFSKEVIKEVPAMAIKPVSILLSQSTVARI